MRRIVLVVLAVAAVGCAAREPVAPVGPAVEHYREVLVQTIPRGAWVEHNRSYVGVAPIVVRVPASSERGLPRGLQIILVKDASGAWEQKVLMPGVPVPERMLFDLRGLSGVRSGLSWR
jgi:hypothetical protein